MKIWLLRQETKKRLEMIVEAATLGQFSIRISTYIKDTQASLYDFFHQFKDTN